MFDSGAKELAYQQLRGATVASRSPIERVSDQIVELELRLKDLKELKEILESEPKLSRALEIMSGRGIY